MQWPFLYIMQDNASTKLDSIAQYGLVLKKMHKSFDSFLLSISCSRSQTWESQVLYGWHNCNGFGIYDSVADMGANSRHDDVIKWKHFPRNWPFVRGIHRSPVNSPHKGQWRGALMFSLICVWINDWVNNREAGDWDAIAPIMTSL